MKNVPIINLHILPIGMKGIRVNVSHLVTSLRYEDVDDKADKLTITIDNDDLSNFDEPIFRSGSAMLVSWGYADVMTVERLMRIEKISGFRVLTLEALGGEVALDKIERVDSWTKVKRSDVAQAIAERWGYRQPYFQHIEDSEVIFPQITQPKMTDGQLLRKLAREQGWCWYIQQDGFHFHSRPDDEPPIRTFRYYADQPDQEISAILDISLEIDVTRKGGVKLVAHETLERFGILLDGTDLTDDERRGFAVIKEARGQEVLGTPLEDAADIAIERTVASTYQELRQNTAAALDRLQNDAVKLSLTVVGDPNIYAKTMIAVDGIGRRLSQEYYVKSVTHIIGQGYTTQLECLSDGSKGVLKTSKFLSESMVIDMNGPRSKSKKKQEDVERPGILLDEELRKQRDRYLERMVAETMGKGPTTSVNAVEDDVRDLSTDPNTSNPNNAPQPQLQTPPEPEPSAVDGLKETGIIGPQTNLLPDDPRSKALEPGNIDLTHRPYVKTVDEEGRPAYATVRSISITESDGFTYLIPTVSDDGRIMSDDEARATFRSTRQHMGVYGNHEEADAASIRIHEDQVEHPPVNTLGPTPVLGDRAAELQDVPTPSDKRQLPSGKRTSDVKPPVRTPPAG